MHFGAALSASLRTPTFVAVALAALFLATPVQPADAQSDPSSSLTRVGDMVLGAHNVRRDDRARPSGFVGLDHIVALPWPGGRMSVVFEGAVSAEQQAYFFDVCGRWSDAADVRCVAASPGDEALTVTAGAPGSGCHSVVGYGPYYRLMNLEASCWYDGVVLHEIGHALGLLHEHQRPDRDAFVAVDYANIQPAYRFAFDYGFGRAHGPYDLRSVMHYQWYAFAADGGRPALTPRGGQPTLMHEMGGGVASGSSVFPSVGDRAAMRSIYGANVAVPAAPGHLRLGHVAGNTVNLVWDWPAGVAPAQGYRIEVASDAAFSRIDAALPLGQNVTSVSGALPSGVRHIRIVPWNGAGDGVPSNTLSFQLPGGELIVPPQAPTLTATAAPFNPVTLAWQPAGGGQPTAYTVVAGTTPTTSDLGVFPMGTATSLTGSVPLDVPIYLRVIAANTAGTAVSDVVSLQIPSQPVLSAPILQPAIVSGHTVVLSWTPTAGATLHTVHARLTDDGPVVASWTVPGHTVTVPNVSPGAYRVSISATVGGISTGESNRIWIVVP